MSQFEKAVILIMESFARLAIKASRFGVHSTYQVGAVIVAKNRVLATGFNHQTKTHPMIRSVDPHKTLHAEIHALIRCGRGCLTGATVIVYRETRSGTMAMAKPCPACQKLLKDHGVSSMVYSTPNGWMTEEIF